ncbi:MULTISPECIES: hypothetical protein [Tardiphaga]|jgi:predicted MFS family arabinose efflux permease|uniref:hypothetical protein n=1 Tax=Tardiphaga TaxID=1395974 RepID=UPI0028EA14D9|nr:hypothetical protein [Tardiphaga sp. 709]WNV11667.1 hypothetical protein RSO67_11065 [Tardiphaga sp. 709]
MKGWFITGSDSCSPSRVTAPPIVPPLQMQVMEAAADADHLASAKNIGAFNLRNAIAAH